MDGISQLDYVWVLIATALVFIMQAGFMCIECGMSRAKNTINVAVKNISDFTLSVVLFWIIGFGLMFGATKSGWWGTSHFLIDAGTNSTAIFFIFQAVFVGTAATICSGAIAERMKFTSYLVISILTSALIYPVFGHWAWGGALETSQQGWLQAMGFKDFAGSTVVHSVGGWIALASIIVVGPRMGKFTKTGEARKIPAHNITLVYLGVFILFFGWFGFNCGSTLAATPDIAKIALNTVLAACFGGLASGILSWMCHETNLLNAEDLGNGVLAGLVGITAGCAFVDTIGAMCIGIISGLLFYFSSRFLEKQLKIDDVVGAVAVHAICGAWGTVAVGIFILPEMLNGISRADQIIVQLIGVLACFIWSFGVGFLLIKGFSIFTGGIRVDRKTEELGLNITEHGASSSVLDLVNAMRKSIIDGDFSQTSKVEVEFGTEIGDLAEGYNQMVDAIHTSFEETKRQARLAEESRKELEVAFRDVDDQRLAADHRRFQIEKISDKLRDVMAEVKQTMDTISGSTDLVKSSVENLQTQTVEVKDVLAAISEIASTSKMLSFNAMIEAEGAGAVGKSFGVVADNMASLASHTRQATRSTLEISTGIEKQLDNVLTNVGTQYASIISGVEKIKAVGELIRSLVEGKDAEELLSAKSA